MKVNIDLKLILGTPFLLAANKYDLIEEYEAEGNIIDDYMTQEFLDKFAENNGFISAHSKAIYY